MQAKVTGMYLRSPPNRRMSTWSFMPCMTEPADRNMQALKKPCVSRCRIANARRAGDADGEEHVADLADRRVGQHLLDVVVRAADHAADDQRDGADDADDEAARSSGRVEDRRASGRSGRRRR